MNNESNKLAYYTAIFLFTLSLAGWFTHVAICINEGRWIFLIVGSFIYPVGSIHGIGVWFSFW